MFFLLRQLLSAGILYLPSVNNQLTAREGIFISVSMSPLLCALPSLTYITPHPGTGPGSEWACRTNSIPAVRLSGALWLKFECGLWPKSGNRADRYRGRWPNQITAIRPPERAVEFATIEKLKRSGDGYLVHGFSLQSPALTLATPRRSVVNRLALAASTESRESEVTRVSLVSGVVDEGTTMLLPPYGKLPK